ncbi:MAG: transposase [Pseudomonadales bacterium]|nr:transposase [Pseudomonadales bacterium]
MGRGLECRNIFAEKEDKIDFLSRIGSSLKQSESLRYEWAIMSNHYHLLINVGHQALYKLLSPILTEYATNCNRRKNRSGYVFQNRFTSILCDEVCEYFTLG